MEIFPESASSYSAEIDSLFWLITVIVSIGFVISLVILILPVVRNRQSRKPRADYITGEKRQHLRWVILGMVIMAVSDFAILFIEHDTWATTQQHVPDEALHVAITGKQWNWVFTYPGPDNRLYTADDVEVDALGSELHIPLNRDVKVDIKARDVLHSVFIPAFRFKYDAIPGRTVTRWFRGTKAGKYDLACAEICGVLHYNMRNYIVVEPEEKFNAYIANLYQAK